MKFGSSSQNFSNDVLWLHGFLFYSFETLIHAYRTKQCLAAFVFISELNFLHGFSYCFMCTVQVEAKEVFFSVTKLSQSKDTGLGENGLLDHKGTFSISC